MFGCRLYRRRSFARRRSYGISRYVTDTVALSRETIDGTQKVCVVAATPTAGIRKVRNFRLRLSCESTCMFALVYFPEGIDPLASTLNSSPGNNPTSLYTPEQHVLTSGILDAAGITVARAARGRSLSNGDHVWLLFRPFDYDQGPPVYAKVTYAIAFG
jgi:hypothetical protein